MLQWGRTASGLHDCNPAHDLCACAPQARASNLNLAPTIQRNTRYPWNPMLTPFQNVNVPNETGEDDVKPITELLAKWVCQTLHLI